MHTVFRYTTLGAFAVFLTGCGGAEFFFTFHNNGADNAHLFVSFHEEKSDANKVEVGSTREVRVEEPYNNDDDQTFSFTVEAHRGEVTLASVDCPEVGDDTRFTVVFTEEGGAELTCEGE